MTFCREIKIIFKFVGFIGTQGNVLNLFIIVAIDW